jgi:hypothetical protein
MPFARIASTDEAFCRDSGAGRRGLHRIDGGAANVQYPARDLGRRRWQHRSNLGYSPGPAGADSRGSADAEGAMRGFGAVSHGLDEITGDGVVFMMTVAMWCAKRSYTNSAAFNLRKFDIGSLI